MKNQFKVNLIQHDGFRSKNRELGYVTISDSVYQQVRDLLNDVNMDDLLDKSFTDHQRYLEVKFDNAEFGAFRFYFNQNGDKDSMLMTRTINHGRGIQRSCFPIFTKIKWYNANLAGIKFNYDSYKFV